uniref:Monocarboxylate transporter 9-like isoform X2 n=1 Tax=Crassostrea virginica TaxID=6565 RepID=A0A8B8DC29_CRAVI|nr:monocarboxylate transporter 9-like isoform X2 [Crassostrea virginica]
MAIDKFGEDLSPSDRRSEGENDLQRMNDILKFIEMEKNQKNSQNSSETESTHSAEQTTENEAPDGGWGWLVCLGSFVINFILDGTMFSFGVMLLTLLEYFGESKAKTSWIGSVLLGLSMILGPFVGWLLDRFTIRQVTLCGAFVATLGFVISTFAQSVEVLIITYGVIGGIGFCMMFIPGIIVVGLYFSRKRALATGIAMSGSGVGTFVYAYLCEALLSEFSWRGTILIMAGILLNCVVCAALFRPLSTEAEKRKRRKRKESKMYDCVKCMDSAESSSTDLSTKSKDVYLDIDVRRNGPSLFNSTSALESKTPARYSFIENSGTAVRQAKRLYSSAHALNRLDTIHRHTYKPFNPLARRDIFYSGSIRNIPKSFTSSETSRSTGELSEFEIDVKEIETHCSCFQKLGGTVDFTLFKNSKFTLLLLCMVLWTAHSITLTFLPDMAVANGIPRDQSASIISICGVSNTVGRILAGFLTDTFHVSSTLIYVVALAMAAATNFLFPWCYNYTTIALCSGVFGLCMASAVCLRTIVIVEQLGLKRLTSAFSMIAFFQGIAFILNPPIAGFLYDYMKSYVYPFILSGSMYAFAALACAAILMKNCVSSKDTSKDNISIVVESEGTSTDESLLNVYDDSEML